MRPLTQVGPALGSHELKYKIIRFNRKLWGCCLVSSICDASPLGVDR